MKEHTKMCSSDVHSINKIELAPIINQQLIALQYFSFSFKKDPYSAVDDPIPPNNVCIF